MGNEEKVYLLERPVPNPNRNKLIALWVVGILTTIYVAAELVLAIWTKSLVLLSDGFHNLSDVVSIGIAYWSIVKSASGASDTMSFGWKRTEVVGALINACSLLSLCLYILLEAIPRFVHPEEILVNKYFLGVAGAGIVVNLFGTIIFYFTGTHAHAHAHDEAEEIIVEEDEVSHGHGHGHSHSGEKKEKKEKSHEHGHAHSINNDDSEDRYVVLDENGIEVKKPKNAKKHDHHDHHDHEHDHDHEHEHHDHDHEHSHSPKQGHEHKKKDKKKKNHSHDHGHDSHSHDHSHDHSLSHDHSHSHGGHGHSHDMNMWAVFIHYLGDAISSVFVLVTGILVFLFPDKKWSLYLDPISSLIIVAIMLYSTIPLVRQCALILLQRVPPHVNLGNLRKKLLKIDHVLGAHDLHVWCLVDGMTICTVHLALDSPDHFDRATKAARKLFHRFGIHSSTVQPEYPLAKQPNESFNSTELQALASRSTQLTSCEQNCLPNCNEDWCCKSPTPTKSHTHGALDFDPVFNPREPDPPRLNPPPGDRLDLV